MQKKILLSSILVSQSYVYCARFVSGEPLTNYCLDELNCKAKEIYGKRHGAHCRTMDVKTIFARYAILLKLLTWVKSRSSIGMLVWVCIQQLNPQTNCSPLLVQNKQRYVWDGGSCGFMNFPRVVCSLVQWSRCPVRQSTQVVVLHKKRKRRKTLPQCDRAPLRSSHKGNFSGSRRVNRNCNSSIETVVRQSYLV